MPSKVRKHKKKKKKPGGVGRKQKGNQLESAFANLLSRWFGLPMQYSGVPAWCSSPELCSPEGKGKGFLRTPGSGSWDTITGHGHYRGDVVAPVGLDFPFWIECKFQSTQWDFVNFIDGVTHKIGKWIEQAIERPEVKTFQVLPIIAFTKRLTAVYLILPAGFADDVLPLDAIEPPPHLRFNHAGKAWVVVNWRSIEKAYHVDAVQCANAILQRLAAGSVKLAIAKTIKRKRRSKSDDIRRKRRLAE